jgi:hypothetical protein
MTERKEPVAGNLDASAEAMASLGVRRAEPAFAGATQPALEMRAGPRPPYPRESRFDLWLAAAIFGAIAVGLTVYFVMR